MKTIAELIGVLVVLLMWTAGVVLASGWFTALAVVFPFYAWYLTVERMMQLLGMIT